MIGRENQSETLNIRYVIHSAQHQHLRQFFSWPFITPTLNLRCVFFQSPEQQIPPRRIGAQDPENSIDMTLIAPATGFAGKQRIQAAPEFLSKISCSPM